MLRIYAAWTEGGTDSDVHAIRCAMKVAPTSRSSAVGCARRSARSGWTLESERNALDGRRFSPA